MPVGGVHDENRCTYVFIDSERNRERNRVGKRCSQPRVNGTDRCKYHGGNTPGKIAKDRLARSLEAFTALWPEDHPLLDPFSLMLWEIRRCANRIEWLDLQLEQLSEAKDLWWGETKQEDITASEFGGVNRTFEARETVILTLQAKERDRLNRLTKEWQDHRFEALRIAGYGAFGLAMRNAVKALAEEFGLDLRDEEIQERIRRVLAEQPDPLPAVEAPKRKKA